MKDVQERIGLANKAIAKFLTDCGSKTDLDAVECLLSLGSAMGGCLIEVTGTDFATKFMESLARGTAKQSDQQRTLQ